MEPHNIRVSRAFGVIGLVLAAAVLVGGVATLAGSTLQAAEPVAGVSGTPLTFDSPSATLERVKPALAPERATAQSDTLLLGDWKFTQAELLSSEAYFLADVLANNPKFFPAMTIMVLYPGFSQLVEAIAGNNFFAQFVVIDFIATVLLGGTNPILPIPTPSPVPVSPTT